MISAVRKRLHNFCQFVHIRYNLRMFRLMVITAHPDDEAGNFGGCLRLYRDHGAQTSVLCLTPGQAATNRGAAKSDREIAELRRRNPTLSLRELGTKCDPPATKAAAARRLNELRRLAGL